MKKDRKVIKSKRVQEKKKKKVKIQQDSESKKKLQKMRASTSAPVRVKYQTRSRLNNKSPYLGQNLNGILIGRNS
ncbi:hypothetical protein QL285_009124 [Trifolium repens]|nr:hypothetical protein QL285_009124 [Trifolium repens]